MDFGHLREVKEIEMGQLHLRYAHTRVEWPAKVLALASSIEQIGHGQMLADHLAQASLSTRELVQFFRHYQKANRKQRGHMVQDPGLFLKALRAKEEAAEAKSLKEGVEGKWGLASDRSSAPRTPPGSLHTFLCRSVQSGPTDPADCLGRE